MDELRYHALVSIVRCERQRHIDNCLVLVSAILSGALLTCNFYADELLVFLLLINGVTHAWTLLHYRSLWDRRIRHWQALYRWYVLAAALITATSRVAPGAPLKLLEYTSG